MADGKNPLLEALPPATDYLTYLTIVEYNLSKENLSTLHEVLQDPILTANIGWDLVHLLIPLLPASEPCLQDIARLGNPREVVLKVTEALRLLAICGDYIAPAENDTATGAMERVDLSASSGNQGHEGGPDNGKATEAVTGLPLSINQFQVLLSMLSTLHLRIKTRYPSRFLSTTLQAILVAYDEGSTHINELSATVVNFVKTLSGTKRPHLPPRRGSILALKPVISQTAPDPEAQAEPPSADEAALTHRLLQSFLTHVFEEHMLLLSSPDDVPGMAWSARAQEKLYPERIIPGKTTYAERFANSPELQERISIIGQLAALGLDLEITSEELLATILDTTAEPTGLPSEEDDPPASAQDISLSKHGALFMFTAREVSEVLHGARPTAPPINIFPQHATVLQNYIDVADPATIGTQEEAIIDTIIALGLLSLSKNNIGEPDSDEQFTLYLQSTSLLSANSPSPTLRYHAHYLTASVLRSHPSDTVRLSFIRDTLEHCPYENLKACAVGWLKGEIIEANPPTPLPASASASAPAAELSSESPAPLSTDQEAKDPSIFTTPLALSTVAPHLFPDLTHDLAAPSLVESYTNFKTSLSFCLATLNFYYLLLCAKHLHKPLDVPGMHQENDIGGSYLWPLRQAVGRFREGLEEGGQLADEEGEEGAKMGLAELRLLEDVLGRVEKGVEALNRE
ncbi:hypothetical protein W97_03340 [Coniosporium apollinis CBS 100218]|uniref:DUF1760-domain-containing protein n=1 Tax=Coniosporium apollinis (strain CBS 100218) TaxID=1168221 RepID=R7YQD2_CONA1|nr:uncharacterized protein W97_03340 [Coniosporium apollinis CBS 100218]EON64110.1 hypothetical protein W97_03340 [Coniosporium apollinis CBS 100218]